MFKKTETNHPLINPTKINQDTSMEGDIVSKNDIRLDGNLIGKMTTKKKIIIGKKGFFNGKLKCENLIVEGKIKGEAKVTNSTALLAYSNFDGVLSTHKFSVEEGASFEGNCITLQENNPVKLPKFGEMGEKIENSEPQEEDQNKSIETEVKAVSENSPDKH